MVMAQVPFKAARQLVTLRHHFGTVLGLMGGFAMAAVVCGKPATLLLIENHLYNLLAVVERNRAPKEI